MPSAQGRRRRNSGEIARSRWQDFDTRLWADVPQEGTPLPEERENRMQRELSGLWGIFAGIPKGLVEIGKLITPGEKEGELGAAQFGKALGESLLATGKHIVNPLSLVRDAQKTTWSETLMNDIGNIAAVFSLGAGAAGTVSNVALKGGTAASKAGNLARAAQLGRVSQRAAQVQRVSRTAAAPYRWVGRKVVSDPLIKQFDKFGSAIELIPKNEARIANQLKVAGTPINQIMEPGPLQRKAAWAGGVLKMRQGRRVAIEGQREFLAQTFLARQHPIMQILDEVGTRVKNQFAGPIDPHDIDEMLVEELKFRWEQLDPAQQEIRKIKEAHGLTNVPLQQRTPRLREPIQRINPETGATKIEPSVLEQDPDIARLMDTATELFPDFRKRFPELENVANPEVRRYQGALEAENAMNESIGLVNNMRREVDDLRSRKEAIQAELQTHMDQLPGDDITRESHNRLRAALNEQERLERQLHAALEQHRIERGKLKKTPGTRATRVKRRNIYAKGQAGGEAGAPLSADAEDLQRAAARQRRVESARRTKFSSRFYRSLQEGKKTKTTRVSKLGGRGEVILTDAGYLRIKGVKKVKLKEVRDKYWKEEGFESPEEFEEVWASLHPKMGYKADKDVWIHDLEYAGKTPEEARRALDRAELRVPIKKKSREISILEKKLNAVQARVRHAEQEWGRVSTLLPDDFRMQYERIGRLDQERELIDLDMDDKLNRADQYAMATSDNLAKMLELDDLANLENAPRGWAPIIDEFQRSRQELLKWWFRSGRKNMSWDSFEEVLADIPSTWTTFQDRMSKMGISEPPRIADFGRAVVQSLSTGQRRLGHRFLDREVAAEAGAAVKAKPGQTVQAPGRLPFHTIARNQIPGKVFGSVETTPNLLVSMAVEPVWEGASNKLNRWLHDNGIIRTIAADQQPPAGWTVWNTNTPDGGVEIVPNRARSTLQKFAVTDDPTSILLKGSADFIDFLRVGVLHFSPKWLMNNAFGNFFLATVSEPGTVLNLNNWRRGYKDARNKKYVDLPSGQQLRMDLAHDSVDARLVEGSAIKGDMGYGAYGSKHIGQGPISRQPGIKQVVDFTAKLNSATDQFFRAMVYKGKVRKKVKATNRQRDLQRLLDLDEPGTSSVKTSPAPKAAAARATEEVESLFAQETSSGLPEGEDLPPGIVEGFPSRVPDEAPLLPPPELNFDKAAMERSLMARHKKTQAGLDESPPPVRDVVFEPDEIIDAEAIFEKTSRGEKLTPDEMQIVEEATEESIKAMVDYGNLSPFERVYMRRIIPFYAWQKNVAQLAMSLPLDHPSRFAALEMISKTFGGYSEEERETLPDYLVPSVELPGGFRLSTRGLNPFQDALSLFRPDGQGIKDSLNPILEEASRFVLRAPENPFGTQEVGPYGFTQGIISPTDRAANLVRQLPAARLIEDLVKARIPDSGTADDEIERGSGTAGVGFFGFTVKTPEEVGAASERLQKERREALLSQMRSQRGVLPTLTEIYGSQEYREGMRRAKRKHQMLKRRPRFRQTTSAQMAGPLFPGLGR